MSKSHIIRDTLCLTTEFELPVEDLKTSDLNNIDTTSSNFKS